MKNLIKIGCVLVLGLSSNLSFAADWKYINYSDEHVYGIDINSISQVNEYSYQKYKKAWIKNVIKNDLSKDGMTVGDYSMMLYWADCNTRTLGLKTSTSYKSNGKVIPNYSFSNSYVSMQDVIPETIGEGIIDAICGN